MSIEQNDIQNVNTAPVEPAAQDFTPDNSSLEGDPAAPVVPAFTPDFKFKVMDEVHEIPEKFRSIVKSEDDLKEVKRLFEQAKGLKHLEASRDEFKNKYGSAEPRLNEYAQVEQRLTKLSHFVQQNDFGSFFNELKIPEKTIFQWVKSRLDEMALDPSVRQQIESGRQTAAQKYDMDQELARFRQQEAETQINQTNMAIDQTIASVAGDVAAEFNTRMNEPLAFRNAVINKGLSIQQSTGQKVPLAQAIEMVKGDLARVMGITGQNPAAPALPVEPQAPAAAVAPQDKPPVIPAIKAGGASPVKQAPKSIADLKNIYNNL